MKFKFRSPFPFSILPTTPPYSISTQKFKYRVCPPPPPAYCIFIFTWLRFIIIFSPSFCWLSERVISLFSYTYINKLIYPFPLHLLVLFNCFFFIMIN